MRTRTIWLWLVLIGGCALTLLVSGGPLEWRLAAVTLLIFVLPGVPAYALIFPNSRAPLAEQAVLMVGLSMALTLTALWALCLSSLAVSPQSMLALLGALAAALCLCLWRRCPGTASATRLPGRGFGGIGFTAVLVSSALFALYNLNYAELVGDERSVMYGAIALLQGKAAALFAATKGPAQLLLATGYVGLSGSLLEGAIRLPFALSAVLGAVAFYLIARLRLRAPAAVAVSLLLVVHGLLLYMSRWIQYQPIVWSMSLLAFWCAWRASRAVLDGLAIRYWLLCALFFGIALMAHYDAALAAPAYAYLFWRRRRMRQPAATAWVWVAAMAAITGAGASFYPLALLIPQAMDAIQRAYLAEGGRVDLTRLPYNNLPAVLGDLLYYESAYRLPVSIALAGVAVASGVARARAHHRAAKAILAASTLALIIAVWAPDAPRLLGINWAFFPFLAWVFAYCWLERDPYWVAGVLWFAAAFGFAAFAMSNPRDHYFIGLFPLIWLMGRGLTSATLFVRRLAGAQWPIARIAFAVVLAAWLMVLAGYASLEYHYGISTTLLTHPESAPILYPQLADPRGSTPTARKLGWRAVAVLYDKGELRGEYESAVLKVTDWYLYKVWEPLHPAPRYYFAAASPFVNTTKGVPSDLADTHDLRGVVTVGDDERIWVYQRKQPGGAPAVQRWAAEDFESDWARLASLDRITAFKQYGRDDATFYTLARTIRAREQAGDALLFDRVEGRSIFSQYYSGALPYEDAHASDASAGARRIWAVLWGPPNEDAERDLVRRNYHLSSEWFGNVRLRLFASQPDTPIHSLGARFGDLATLEGSALPAGVSPGGWLPLRLGWRAESPDGRDYKLFVHIVGATLEPIAQADSEPAAGLRPTSTWQSGERIEDRIGVPLPAGTKPSTYRVLAGMYDPQTGARLPAYRPDGTRYENDAVVLGSLAVQ